MRNSTAVMLTVAGGILYVIGGLLVLALASAVSSFGSLSGLGLSSLPGFNSTSIPSVSSSGFSGLIDTVGGFGIIAGFLIIFGGILFQSQDPNRRKAGGIIAVVMLVIGALPALGGLVIGFILAAIGCYMGLTYKAARSNLAVGLGPVGSVTLGPQTAASSEAGTGPLNYCIKCGSRLRDGAVFCGACGARVPD